MPNCPSHLTVHNTNVCVSLMFSVWRPCVWHYDVDHMMMMIIMLMMMMMMMMMMMINCTPQQVNEMFGYSKSLKRKVRK